MASASHGVVTLSIWSEPTTTPGPVPLNIHVNNGFVTVVIYPHQVATIFPETEKGFDSGNRPSPWIVEEVGLHDQQDGRKQTEETASPRNDAASKETEDMKVATQVEIQVKPRFWSEDPITSRAASTPIPSAKTKNIAAVKSTKSEWGLDKGSIAAVVIISFLTCACLAFLGYWYVARECKSRRHRRLRENDNQFNQASLTLGEETSKALDEFLMKEVESERTSIMFSRSRSPSITYAVDGIDLGSSKTSRNSILKMDPLARESADGTRPSFIISDLTGSSGSKTASSGSKSGSSDSETVSKSSSSSGSKTDSTGPIGSDSTPAMTTEPTSTPRTSLQLSPRASVGSSILPPTTRSSQLWATTSAETTEKSSLLSNDQKSPRSSLSSSYSSNMLPSSVSSFVPSYSHSQRASESNASQSSGRYFVQNPVRSQPRMINDFGSSRRNHQRSYSSQSMTISPIEEIPDSLGTAPPTSMFRFSDAS